MMEKEHPNFTNKKIDYLKVTDAAISEIITKTSKKDEVFGIRITIKTRGCSGMAYQIEPATINNISEYDEMVDTDKTYIFIDPKISLFLFNTEMDFIEKKAESGLVIESGFIFKNPNETGRCGCGESFYI